MSVYKLGDVGPKIIEIEQDLVKHGFGTVGHMGDLNPSTFDQDMKDRVELFQAQHHDVTGKPLDVDGAVGIDTLWALKHPSEITAPPTIASTAGPIFIRMKGVKLPFYADHKDHTFWLAEDVADSFMEGIAKWREGGGQYIVTGAYRSVQAQAIAKKAKPGLCCAAGWSMHGHGRAVDGHITNENASTLIEFYTHMEQFGWYTIFNFPNLPVLFKARESWHIQRTDPAGMRSSNYLKGWAVVHGGEDALLRVQKQEV
jgi:hypothetical protein